MRGDEKAHTLSLMDKKIINAIKEAAWDDVIAQVEELRQKLAEAAPSKADSNWNPSPDPLGFIAGISEKKLALAVAEGYASDEFLAAIPTSTGVLGDTNARGLDLVRVSGQELCFFDLKVTGNGEEIFKALRNLIVQSVLYRAFLANPRRFGYNTEKSPLLLDDVTLSWELVGPKDMINPRKTEMRWGERDTQAMQKIMGGLGVRSFSLSRLQAEAEVLRNNIEKDNFSGSRARQWFENRVTVLVA